MNPHPKILLIEDDPGIVAGLKKELQAEGYHVATAMHIRVLNTATTRYRKPDSSSDGKTSLTCPLTR